MTALPIAVTQTFVTSYVLHPWGGRGSDSGIVDIFYQFLLDTLKLIVLMGTCDVQETDFANDL